MESRTSPRHLSGGLLLVESGYESGTRRSPASNGPRFLCLSHLKECPWLKELRTADGRKLSHRLELRVSGPASKPVTKTTYRIKAINEYGVSERSRWFHIDTPAAP